MAAVSFSDCLMASLAWQELAMGHGQIKHCVWQGTFPGGKLKPGSSELVLSQYNP